MKKILLVISVVLCTNISFAAFTIPKPNVSVAETKEQRERAMMEMVVKMSVKDYENLRGKKLNVIERFIFKIEKKRFERQLKKADRESTGVNIGGFLVGLFLFPIGIILAYIFSRDRNFRKWAWVGTGLAAFVFLLVLLLAAAVSGIH